MMALLKMSTELEAEKITQQVKVKIEGAGGFFEFLNGKTVAGYEIHAGKSVNQSGNEIVDFGSCNVLGTYIHGFFDAGDIALSLIRALAERKGLALPVDSGSRSVDFKAFKESQYDLLADTLRKSLDMKAIYNILGIPGKKEAGNE